jgi:hypothetical protein
MFGSPIKHILKFSMFFFIFVYKPKYRYTIMYACDKSQTSHELSKIGLFNSFHLNFFLIKYYLKKITLQKS